MICQCCQTIIDNNNHRANMCHCYHDYEVGEEDLIFTMQNPAATLQEQSTGPFTVEQLQPMMSTGLLLTVQRAPNIFNISPFVTYVIMSTIHEKKQNTVVSSIH
jgi:hypothetical protein